MNNEVLYEETQKFKQWWIWVILLGINLLSLFRVYKQVLYGQEFGDKPVSNEGLLVSAVATILLTVLFTRFQLETQIRKDGIYVRFFPFHLAFKRFAWDKISKSFVRQYNPISEYGGWGLRLGLFGKGRAFNVSGDRGLQLEFFDNKKLLIGTNKPEELTKVLASIGQIKE